MVFSFFSFVLLKDANPAKPEMLFGVLPFVFFQPLWQESVQHHTMHYVQIMRFWGV